jgi:hypothetical protein
LERFISTGFLSSFRTFPAKIPDTGIYYLNPSTLFHNSKTRRGGKIENDARVEYPHVGSGTEDRVFRAALPRVF